MELLDTILLLSVCTLASGLAAFVVGHFHGARDALQTIDDAIGPFVVDGKPLPRDKSRFGSFFAPGEKVTIRADPTPTLAGLGRYEAIADAAGITAAEVKSVLDGVIEEIATELLDDCWRERIATRLTEWQREQAA